MEARTLALASCPTWCREEVTHRGQRKGAPAGGERSTHEQQVGFQGEGSSFHPEGAGGPTEKAGANGATSVFTERRGTGMAMACTEDGRKHDGPSRDGDQVSSAEGKGSWRVVWVELLYPEVLSL